MTEKHRPTPETRAVARAFASVGIKTTHIARYLGISEGVLLEVYGDDMNRCRTEVNGKVARRLYAYALGEVEGQTHKESIVAAMFVAKTQMGWRERDVGDGGDPQALRAEIGVKLLVTKDEAAL